MANRTTHPCDGESRYPHIRIKKAPQHLSMNYKQDEAPKYAPTPNCEACYVLQIIPYHPCILPSAYHDKGELNTWAPSKVDPVLKHPLKKNTLSSIEQSRSSM